MERTGLTCKDSGRFFHDCKDCQHYNECDYFDKKERRVKKRSLTKASTLELIFQMNVLHADSKRRPQDDGVPKTDLWEATAIIKELKHRLGRLGVFFAGGKDEQIIKKGN